MLKEGTFTKKKFRSIFIAAILGWVVSLLGGMADSIIAGVFVKDADAVSAIGLVTPIESIVYFFSLAIAVGCAILYSRTLGAYDVKRSKELAGMGLFVSIVLGVAGALILFFGKNAILDFYGVTGNVRKYAIEYFVPIIFIGLIYPVQWTLYYLVSYDGDEKIILVCDVLTAVSNAGFSVLLVQRMGVAGLGWGTVISNVLAILVVMPHFFRKSNSISFRWHFSWKDLGRMVKVSSAVSLITLYMGIVDIVFNKIVIAQFGEEYLTAYAVINVVMNFACALNCAINAGAIFVSVAYGENNNFALKRVMNLTNKYAIISSLALTAILELLSTYWPRLYAIQPGTNVYEVAVFAGRIVPAFFIIAAFVYTYLTYYPIIGRIIEGNILVLCYMLIGPLVVSLPMAKIGSTAIARFNMMSLGFGLTPAFALIVAFVYILIRGQAKKLPYLLDETDDKEAHYDIRLDDEGIVGARDKIAEFLAEQGIDAGTVNKVRIVFEDSMYFIKKKNEKKVLCEVTVLVNTERIKLITKDNGIIFDITKEADDSVDFQAYVLARMITDAKEASNSTTTSFNRNVCVWELKEAE